MKTEELKNDILCTLINSEYGELGISLDDLINKTRTAVAKLHGEDVPLEDIREGEFSKVTLAEAVEKLGFELQNDRDLYSSYRLTLSTVIYNNMIEAMNIEVNDTNELSKFAERCAEDFLDKFIQDTLRNKQKNEEQS